MKSLFWRNFLVYSGMLLIVFVLFGGAFIIQANKYAGAERKRQLEYAAERISKSTSAFLDSNYPIFENAYETMLSQTCAENDIYALVCTDNGRIAYFVTSNGEFISNAANADQSLIREVVSNGKISKTGNISFFRKPMYIVGVQIVTRGGNLAGTVFTLSSADGSVRLLSSINKVFTLGILSSFAFSLAAAYIVTERLTKPLKNISDTAKKFSNGDFSVRLKEETLRPDEVGELAASFNNMAVCLEQSDKRRREFIANVSHDLKTPMTTIAGFADGILDGTVPPDKQKEYLGVISSETKRLSRLVSEILEMSKIDAGEIHIQKTCFDICELTSQVILSFERALNNSNVDVQISMPASLIISADRDMMFRVIYNLTDNAVKFINGGGTLKISISQSGSLAVFSISNTGNGIAPENLPFVFDRFYKEDSSRSKKKRGFGLGLYIVKNIVNMHGGSVYVSSKNNITEFRFKIPI